MKVIIGSCKACESMREIMKVFLHEKNIDVVDVSKEGDNFLEVSLRVAKEVQKDLKHNRGIIIDEYGAGPFMVADKVKYIICAELNDEHSAKMTRDHNNANVITFGTKIVGEQVAKNIVDRFVTANYAGGRHQIRIDMLNKMC